MKYCCNFCSYETNLNSNYDRHLLTDKHKSNKKKKHIINNNNGYICTNCNIKFMTLQGLHKHEKTCSVKSIELIKNEYDNKIKNLENKIEQLQNKIEQLQNIINILDTENNYHKILINNVGNIVKTSVNALSYVVKNYNNAPIIESFSDFELLKTSKNDTLEELVVYYYRINQLDKYIGNIIVQQYKKTNPKEQAIWNTDTSRLAYLVRELINEKPEWSVDKGGIKVLTYIVTPILNYIKNMLQTYLGIQEKKKVIKMNEINEKINIMRDVNVIIYDIDKGILGNSVIRYISAHFYLSKSNSISN